MQTVLIVAHLLIVVAMIAVILLQRSEGGALGIGGGGGLMSARSSANLLTRTTAILAALFFATSVGLTLMSQFDRSTAEIIDRAGAQIQTEGSVLDALGGAVGSGDTGNTAPATDTGAPAAPESQ